MNDDNDKHAEPAEHTEADAAEPAPVEPDAAAALKAENADLRERLIRAMAEMENLRKRTERETRDAAQYAISHFARDLLGVGDNMRRALETVDAENREAADRVLIGLLDGIEMTERELLKTLEKHGVRRIDPEGERFDPNYHQAIFEVPDPAVAAGTVVQVVQPGYLIGERCLRPAMVGVAKGGPKPGARPDAEAAGASQTAGEQIGASVDKTA